MGFKLLTYCGIAMAKKVLLYWSQSESSVTSHVESSETESIPKKKDKFEATTAFRSGTRRTKVEVRRFESFGVGGLPGILGEILLSNFTLSS